MNYPNGTRFDCGCVKGYYWCGRHDIYSRRDNDDLPPFGAGDSDRLRTGTIKAKPVYIPGVTPEGIA